MLERMRHLAVSRKNFAFETTLASRTLAPWLAAWQRDGYHVHLLFLWLKSAELAVTRVTERVRLGGHDVPAEVVRRRYAAGLQNLFQLYMPLVDSWQLFDNSEGPHPVPIAAGDRHSVRKHHRRGGVAEVGGLLWSMTSRILVRRSIASKTLDLVQRALARAVRQALIRHKQAGNPICVWREGQVVWIAPEDIQIPDEPK